LLTRYARVSPFLFPVYPTLVTENDILKEKEKGRGEVFSVIAVGRLTPEKGLDVLVEAISILVSEDYRSFVKS